MHSTGSAGDGLRECYWTFGFLWVEVWLHLFVIWVLDEGGWSTPQAGHFNLGRKDLEQVAQLPNRQIFKDLCILHQVCVAMTLAWE